MVSWTASILAVAGGYELFMTGVHWYKGSSIPANLNGIGNRLSEYTSKCEHLVTQAVKNHQQSIIDRGDTVGLRLDLQSGFTALRSELGLPSFCTPEENTALSELYAKIKEEQSDGGLDENGVACFAKSVAQVQNSMLNKAMKEHVDRSFAAMKQRESGIIASFLKGGGYTYLSQAWGWYSSIYSKRGNIII